MSTVDFHSLPLIVRRAIIAEAHAQARANHELHFIGIEARIGRAYRALVACA